MKSSLLAILIAMSMPAMSATVIAERPGPEGGLIVADRDPAFERVDGQSPPTTLPSNWDFLAGTYWYVPAEDLPAFLYDIPSRNGVFAIDQTVFYITDSRGGYFKGTAVVQLGPSRASFVMLGVVTPDGSVILDFLPQDASGVATGGTGRFTFARGQLAMLNQMSSSPNSRLKVLHWAYMMRTQPGDPSWDRLPGANVSVPDFLAGR